MLIVDGSKTHISPSNITECKELRVEVVVLPALSSDILQPPGPHNFQSPEKGFHAFGKGTTERAQRQGSKPCLIC